MQIKSAPSTQDVFVLGTLLAAILLAAALSARVAPLRSPVLPVPEAPAQSAPAQSLPVAPVERPAASAAPGNPVTPADPGAQTPGGSGQVERPGRMFDDMPNEPPVHEPGTGTPRYAGE